MFWTNWVDKVFNWIWHKPRSRKRYKFSPKSEVYSITGLIRLHFVTKLKLDTVLSFPDFFCKLKDDSNSLCYPTVCALKKIKSKKYIWLNAGLRNYQLRTLSAIQRKFSTAISLLLSSPFEDPTKYFYHSNLTIVHAVLSFCWHVWVCQPQQPRCSQLLKRLQHS